MKRAKFAVVGHPNKGKSSIVATLARNDKVEISQRSGTTDKAATVRVETASSGYELIDTPGFQRPVKVLAWLKAKNVGAEQRANLIAEFVADADCRRRFPDEVELLTPLVKGAAILYVVDGSRPYGAEYEAEMEILSWTGRPSMALINPIEGDTHIKVWQDALAQYFKSVRIFNPMEADFTRQLELLEAFAHLEPLWANTLKSVISDLTESRALQKNSAAIILARLLEDLCCYQASQKVISYSQAEALEPLLAKQYQVWMVAREDAAIKELLALYAHYNTQLTLDSLTLPPELFDCQHWYLWGLNKQQLALASGLAGAVAGAGADLMVAGHSLMLGAVGGGLVGAASAWFGADKLAVSKVKGLPLGGFEAIYGPMKNKNFPYVVIGRFVHIFNQISQRNHAQREALLLESGALKQAIDNLSQSKQKTLHTSCAALLKQNSVDDLESIIAPLFNQ